MSQSHRTDQGSSDNMVSGAAEDRFEKGRNPTVLIRAVPTLLAKTQKETKALESQSHRTDQSSSDDVSGWEVWLTAEAKVAIPPY